MAFSSYLVVRLIFLQLCWISIVTGRHIERWQNSHRLTNRQIPPWPQLGQGYPRTSTTVSTITTATRSSPPSQISDSIETLQKVISELSSDLANLVNGLEERLQVMEDTVRGLFLQMPGPVSIPPEASNILTSLGGYQPTFPLLSSTSKSTSRSYPSSANSTVRITRTIQTTLTRTITSSTYLSWASSRSTPMTSSTSFSRTSSRSISATWTTASSASSRSSLPPTANSTALYSPPVASGAYPTASNPAVSLPTSLASLQRLCSNVTIDYITIPLVLSLVGPGDYPTLARLPGCTAPTYAQEAAGAAGLLNCSTLGFQVQSCQLVGKKVLLALGPSVGAEAGAQGLPLPNELATTAQAAQVAGTLWGLFGAGTTESTGLRPLGEDVVLDGFDVTIPPNMNDSQVVLYGQMVERLKEFAEDDPRTYYVLGPKES